MPAELKINKSWILQFALHIATGGISVLVHYALMGLLLRMGINEIQASSFGFFAGAITRLFTAYFLIFKPIKALQTTILKFVFSLIIQFFLNLILITCLVNLGFGLWISQIVITATLTSLNFLNYRFWVFR